MESSIHIKTVKNLKVEGEVQDSLSWMYEEFEEHLKTF